MSYGNRCTILAAMAGSTETSPLYQIFLREPVDRRLRESVGWQKKIIPVVRPLRRYRENQWILLTGCFDGKELTEGHLSLFQALAHVAPLVVAVESDDTLWWNKGMFRPYMHQEDRVARVARRPEIAGVIPLGDTVFYGGRYPISKSRARFVERFTVLHPPMVPIASEDPFNAYPFGMNADAKTIGATRLVYEYYPAPSTAQRLGY